MESQDVNTAEQKKPKKDIVKTIVLLIPTAGIIFVMIFTAVMSLSIIGGDFGIMSVPVFLIVLFIYFFWYITGAVFWYPDFRSGQFTLMATLNTIFLSSVLCLALFAIIFVIKEKLNKKKKLHQNNEIKKDENEKTNIEERL